MKRKKRQHSVQPDVARNSEAKGEDYVFRFSLRGTDAGEEKSDDPLLELVRGQLADLLDIAVLTYHGRRVIVDGFRLLQDPDTQYEIYRQRFSDGGSGSGRR